jgi:predicted MFS family arabinose efflux permease
MPSSDPRVPPFAIVFLPFAAAYFLSYVMRSVNAVLSEPLTEEFALTASQLGLLSSSYFLTFAIMQLPLGALLDRHSPRRVEIVLLMFAIGGCLLSSLAEGFFALWLSRAMIGIGVSACLMASYTSYRLCFPADRQASLASLMLMVGSFGGLAATLPVELLLPALGWRGIFVLTAVLFLLSVASLTWLLPNITAVSASSEPYWRYTIAGAKAVFSHPQVQRLIPVCIFTHGGFLAVQSLWMGPWLRTVEGQPATEAATTLLVLGITVMLSHLAMSWLGLRLNRWRLSLDRVLIAGYLLMLLFTTAAIANLWNNPLIAWSLVFVTTSVSGLIYAKTSLAFPVEMGGRANTGINFVVFAGAFGMQWGLGLITDLAMSVGQSEAEGLRTAFISWAFMQAVALIWLVRNPQAPPPRQQHAEAQ